MVREYCYYSHLYVENFYYCFSSSDLLWVLYSDLKTSLVASERMDVKNPGTLPRTESWPQNMRTFIYARDAAAASTPNTKAALITLHPSEARWQALISIHHNPNHGPGTGTGVIFIKVTECKYHRLIATFLSPWSQHAPTPAPGALLLFCRIKQNIFFHVQR